jgi:tetratricopeptide (TPR) repeat protein
MRQMGGKIFISYRRDDCAGHAGRLHDGLAKAFGDDNLFMDVVRIEPGADFRKTLQAYLSECQVFLALIGRAWLHVRDEDGATRLADPRDFVRLEILAALERGIPVIPVLFDDARMPREDELPQPLKDLTFRQAMSVRHSHFRVDLDALIEVLRSLLADDWALCRGSDARRGVPACTRIIESDKQTPQGRADALTRRAEFHRIGNRFDQAVADCDAALRLDPNYAPAYVGRSQVYRSKGDFVRAIADADKAVALRPGDPRGYDVRGTAHRENGDLDRAIADYTSAIERDPTYVWPHYNRGFTYAKKGDFAAAIVGYGKVIALDATIPAAFAQRGVAYEAIGNSTEAVRDYRDALALPNKHTTGEWAHEKARERLAKLGVKL